MKSFAKIPELLFLIALIACAAQVSCGRKTIEKNYYLLEFPIIADSTEFAHTPHTRDYCEILPPQVYPAFAQHRIAMRSGSHQVSYFISHEWAVRPDEAISNLIEGYVQSRGLFAGVASRVWPLQPQYQLRTRVQRLEAVQDDKKLTAHLHIDFELFHRITGRVVVSHSSDRYQPLDRKNMDLFALTISAMLAAELQVLADKIATYLITPSDAPNPTDKDRQ